MTKAPPTTPDPFEALSWLHQNTSSSPLACNHFDGKASAIAFVLALYGAGALYVNIHEDAVSDDVDVIKRTSDVYSDTLIVHLPRGKAKREALKELILKEKPDVMTDPATDIDVIHWQETKTKLMTKTVLLWWD